MQENLSEIVEPTLPEPLIHSLREWVERREDGAEMLDVSFAQHSNDVAELRFDHGRTLMVKRGRYDWVAKRFANSRAAADVLREQAGLAAPDPLDLPLGIDHKPLEVYWRIEVPTLAQLWPEMDDWERTAALVSWGAMMRRVHAVGLEGWGPVSGGIRHASFRDFMEADLGDRLIPAVHGEWPKAVPAVEALADALPRVVEEVAGRQPVLVHGDVHMGNILCRPFASGPRCIGLLDLEAATTGLAESDLAIGEVLHGPLFNQPLAAGWEQTVQGGYGVALNGFVLRFFRAFHLANLGFFSALVGDAEHAGEVRLALDREVAGL